MTAGHRGDRWAPFEVHLETFSERARPLARLEPLNIPPTRTDAPTDAHFYAAPYLALMVLWDR